MGSCACGHLEPIGVCTELGLHEDREERPHERCGERCGGLPLEPQVRLQLGRLECLYHVLEEKAEQKDTPARLLKVRHRGPRAARQLALVDDAEN